jgi:Flp pilus assembly pilin Flp
MAAWLLFIHVRMSEAGFSFKRRAAAQGLVEYALLVMLIALIIIAILTLVGQTLCTAWYEEISQKLFSAPPNPTCQ